MSGTFQSCARGLVLEEQMTNWLKTCAIRVKYCIFQTGVVGSVMGRIDLATCAQALSAGQCVVSPLSKQVLNPASLHSLGIRHDRTHSRLPDPARRSGHHSLRC